jgi:predicted DNA binding CopG/RHH family protein
MNKKIKYTNEPMEFKEIKDFLPPPEHFVLKEKNVKVTITLSKNSIDFFKHYAQRSRGHYQTMIRDIIDHYVARHAA